MRVMTEQPLDTRGSDKLDVQVLFPEARARRRRLRFAIGLVLAVVVAIAAIAIDRSGAFGHGPAQVTASSASPTITPRDQITSVSFTETRAVTAPGQALLFDSTPLVKMVVNTTLGSKAPNVDSQSYYTSWTRHPTIYTSATGFEKNGVLFAPNRTARLQICTKSAAGRTVCSVTTKRWIEMQTSQIRSIPAALGTASQSPYDPTKLFEELRTTVRTFVRVGSSRIDGVTTTEYRGNIPAQDPRAVRSAPVAEQTVLRLAVSGDGVSFYGGEHGGQLQWSVTVNFKSVPVEVWVDGQGVVRQIRVATPSIGFQLDDQNQNRIVPLTVTLDYSGFDKPVAPPALPTQDVFVVHGKIVSEQSLSS